MIELLCFVWLRKDEVGVFVKFNTYTQLNESIRQQIDKLTNLQPSEGYVHPRKLCPQNAFPGVPTFALQEEQRTIEVYSSAVIKPKVRK